MTKTLYLRTLAFIACFFAHCMLCATAQSTTLTRCDLSPGRADSYLLALSWQPAFCETYGYKAGKKECLYLSANSFAQQHLVLHGLWPNQDACGKRYGFCGASMQKHHCDYPPLSLTKQTAEQLSTFMPSFASGSCLERHEWYKHGTCQLSDVSSYFSSAIALTKDIDETAFAKTIRAYHGKTISRRTLEEALEKSFGSGNDNKVFLGCKKGMLVDVFISLPAYIPENGSLNTLIAKAPSLKDPSSCSENIYISSFYGTHQ